MLVEAVRLLVSPKGCGVTTRFTNVRVRSRSIGKLCLHCGRAATVTATRRTERGLRLPVRYCEAHWVERSKGVAA